MRAAFVGHQVCDSDPWIYTLPIPFTPGTNITDRSGWFHPTPDGHDQLAEMLEAVIGPPPARPAPAPVPVPALTRIRPAGG